MRASSSCLCNPSPAALLRLSARPAAGARPARRGTQRSAAQRSRSLVAVGLLPHWVGPARL